MSRLKLSFEDLLDNTDNYTPATEEDYLEIKEAYLDSNTDAEAAMEMLTQGLGEGMTLEALRVQLESNERTSSVAALLADCTQIAQEFRYNNMSLEDISQSSPEMLSLALEAINRTFMEKLGKKISDAKTRLGEATSADMRYFDLLKMRHNRLGKAIQNANTAGASVTFSIYELTGSENAATLVRDVNNAAAFYKELESRYLPITEAYAAKATELAVRANQLYMANGKAFGQIVRDLFKIDITVFAVFGFVFTTIASGSLAIGLLGAFFWAIDGAIIAALVSLILGIVVTVSDPIGVQKSVDVKLHKEILALHRDARANYEHWTKSLEGMIKGDLPGEAQFSIEGPSIEFDYHRSKRKVTLELTKKDITDLHMSVGRILEAHRPPSRWRVNTSGMVSKLKQQHSASKDVIPDAFKKENNAEFFQEKDVKEGAPMIPIRVSRYMASLADSVLSAIDKAV